MLGARLSSSSLGAFGVLRSEQAGSENGEE